jgi:hypothetical protein
MAMQGKPLPLHVEQEFADYLKCGRLEHGFLRVQCTGCHHEHLVAFSCKRREVMPVQALFYDGNPVKYIMAGLRCPKLRMATKERYHHAI